MTGWLDTPIEVKRQTVLVYFGQHNGMRDSAPTDGQMMFCSQCNQFCEFIDKTQSLSILQRCFENGLTVLDVFDRSFRHRAGI